MQFLAWTITGFINKKNCLEAESKIWIEPLGNLLAYEAFIYYGLEKEHHK